MTKFIRENFSYFGGYLTYDLKNGERPVFIARFKHQPKDKPTFLTFLIKNFTVEEYLDAMKAGKSPLPILEEKGYIHYFMRQQMKKYGVDTPAEYMAIFRSQMEARRNAA